MCQNAPLCEKAPVCQGVPRRLLCKLHSSQNNLHKSALDTCGTKRRCAKKSTIVRQGVPRRLPCNRSFCRRRLGAMVSSSVRAPLLSRPHIPLSQSVQETCSCDALHRLVALRSSVLMTARHASRRWLDGRPTRKRSSRRGRRSRVVSIAHPSWRRRWKRSLC